MSRAPWAAAPVLQAIWALCSHADFESGCDACEMRLLALTEHLDSLRAGRAS